MKKENLPQPPVLQIPENTPQEGDKVLLFKTAAEPQEAYITDETNEVTVVGRRITKSNNNIEICLTFSDGSIGYFYQAGGTHGACCMWYDSREKMENPLSNDNTMYKPTRLAIRKRTASLELT